MKNIILCFIVIIIYSCSSGSSSKKKSEKETVVDTVLYDKIERCSEEDGKLIFYTYTVKGKTGILDKDKHILVEAKYESCIFKDGFYIGIMNNEVLEVFKKDGTLFFDAAKGIKLFDKEELCDGRYFYNTYSDDYDGALSYDGAEIFPVNYKNLYYCDKEEDPEAEGELIQTFVAEDKSGVSRLLYVYIDDDNKVKRYPIPLQEGIYESKQYYDKKDTIQLRVYKDYILFERIKIPYYTYKNGSKYYGDEGSWYYFSNNYKSFHYDSKYGHRDYHLIYKLSEDDFIFKKSQLTHTKSNEQSGAGNGNSGLLYKGTYTIKSQGYCENTGNYTDILGPDFTAFVEIYDDYIIVMNGRYDYIGTSNGWKIFHNDIENSGTRIYYKVNPTNFEMSQYSVSQSTYTGGYITITYAMTKGETQFRKKQSPTDYVSKGNSKNSNNKNYREPVRNPCRACSGTGDCPVCKGRCQTQTKVVYHYDGCRELEWEQCKSCGGSGRHQGCGGDGWLDEGVDF